MSPENYEFNRFLSTDKDSRWATPNEIKSSSFVKLINIEGDDCPYAGLPLISDGKTAYIDNSDAHTLIVGSTGSKKTRLFGLPLINLCAMAGESFIATDPKGELYNRTSGLVQSKGYQLVVLNFRDLMQSDYWNPLKMPYELYHGGYVDEAMSSINDFITALAEPQRANTKDKYMIELAYSQALANMLFFIDTATAEQANIYNFTSFFLANSTPQKTANLVEHIAQSSICGTNFNSVLTNKEDERSFSNVSSAVSVMLNPFIIRKTLCQVLSQSSFEVNDIGKTKTAIYIIVPDEKTTLNFLVTTFIKQVYESLISVAQKQHNVTLPMRVNFILDEFCNIPTIPDMASMVSAGRSRNIRFFIMTQSQWQLRQKYKEDADTIKGNCENWVFLTSREYDLLSELSKLCGNTISKDDEGNRITSPLITISELQRLKKEHGEALLLQGRNYPFVTQLPDIDQYAFKKIPTVKRENKELPRIKLYSSDTAINSIIRKDRPLPFSKEAYGHDVYYLDEFDPSKAPQYF